MYLEEVILDGFKSYAVRTVIGPFHSQFNAISGLNGTGKSNILDALCFVMGIKSLQQMRVAKVDELIYKQGQAGVTKASVTLIFRNENRRLSPIGMTDIPKITISRQIAVGGRDRFVMNGHSVRPVDIQTVFQSVQLNVNNPHFLVMQGRITKVINMKPPEILGMIEESAGTRLYEAKRSESARKIALKESKLTEINSLLQNEIEPALEDLRKEQAEYTASLRGLEQIAALERYCRAYDYYRVIKDMAETKESQTACERQLSQVQETTTKMKENIQELDLCVKEEQRKLGTATQEAIQRLTQKKRNLENDLSLRLVAGEHAKKEEDELEAELKELEKVITKTKHHYETLMKSSEAERGLELTHQECLNQLKKQEEDTKALLEELQTGHVSNAAPSTAFSTAGTAATRQTVRQQLVAAELRLREAESEEKMLSMSLEKWKNDLQALRSEAHSGPAAKQEEARRGIIKSIAKREEAIEKLKETLKDLEQSETTGEELQKTKTQLESKIAGLEETVFQLRRKIFPVTRLHQENPNCRAEGIQGTAAELFWISDENDMYTLALEESGKSRLLNVVVHDDEVAKGLLQKYRTIRRITCIPLNKIRASGISDERLRLAKQAACLPEDSKAIIRPLDAANPLAPQYQEALTYVFGQTFLCASPEIAQRVCQNPRVKGFAVTLSGDQYNPTGSISGGSQAGLGGLLANLKQLKLAEPKLESLRCELRDVCRQLEETKQKIASRTQILRQLGSLTVDLEALTNRLTDIDGSSLQGKEEKLQLKLKETQQAIDVLHNKTIPQIRDVEIPRLKQEADSLTSTRSERMEKLHEQIRRLKPQIASVSKELKRAQEKTNDVKRELAATEEQLIQFKLQLEHKTGAVRKEKKDASDAIKNACNLLTQEIQQVDEELATLEKEHKKQSREAARLSAERSSFESQLAENEAQIAKMQHSLRCFKQQLNDANKRRSLLLRDFPWLQKEERLFDTPKSPFDFQKTDVKGCFEKLETLKRENDRRQKHVNQNVLTVLEACEKELYELKEKKLQLTRDKKKLEEFIDELDIKKNQTLNACWKQVDNNFSSIFSMLLPGSEAHLVLTDPNNLKEGIEMQVTLSGIKKLSLSELSGGQRSLLSLSLVLALLKYKPAPLYILDEIDAALDLSHTQKIGKMIRTQFSQSQFLVVSLKENLFNYADVLFRTSFTAGSSQVTRIVNNAPDENEGSR